MADEDVFASVVETDSEADGEQRVTSVMGPELFEELERWREARDISRSQAVRELVEAGLQDETWADRVTDAQEALEGPDIVAFTVAAVTADASVNVKLSSRQGLEEELPIEASEQSQQIFLAIIYLLETYSDMAGVEFSDMWEAIYQVRMRLRESGAVEEFNLSGGVSEDA